LRRILTGQAVDRLPEQVGMADVPGVLIVQVNHQTPEIR
jgi:hypothetical protein